ncbi:MAG: hypothetical protein KDI79_14295 [Anaerolineae bacterium]|nr:hypothetical protein [Anaerolineae bacterium]
MKKMLILIIAMVTIILVMAYYETIRPIVLTVAILLAVLVVLGVGLILFLAIWQFVERVKLLRAQRIEAEKQAHVLTITAGNQVFVRDTDQRATWRLLHLEARTLVNQTAPTPDDQELQRWQIFNMPSSPASKVLTALPSPTPIDLMMALDSAQCALIVGQRGSGKTTVLQHVIGRRLGKAHILVLDPHSHPTRWPSGCQVVGTERDFVKIEMALRGLLALMNKRYRDIGKGLVAEGAHEPVLVVIDEWRAIVFQLGKPAADIIKTLLAESRKTNIDVFIGSHSERVKALGIEGEGDLKEGFVMVRLTVNKLTGERKATIDYGDGEMPTTLPGPFPVNRSSQSAVGGQIISLGPQPTEQEQQILAMYRNGKSFRAISKAVFDGKVGQFYNDKIKEVLEKFGEK